MTSPSLFDQAVARHRAGDLAAAEDLYLQALAADPQDFRAAYNAGVLLLRSGRADEAAALLTLVVQRDGSRLQNWLAYAEALAASGRTAGALEVIARLRAAGQAGERLDTVEAQALAKQAGPLSSAEAEPLLRRAIALDPGYAPAHAALGLRLSTLGRHEEAEPAYRAALELAPEDAATWANLGASLARLGRDDEAGTCLSRALAMDPSNGPARNNLGALLRDQGRLEEARANFVTLAAADVGLGVNLQARLALSPVVASEADLAAQRQAFAEGLEALNAEPRRLRHTGEPFPLSWYYLAYHGLDDRPLIGRTAEVLAAKTEDLAHVAPGLDRWRGPAGRRIRVAFVSSFFRDHSVGRMYEHFVRRLDRSQFEAVVVHGPGAVRDGLSAGLEAAADAVVTLDGDLQRQRTRLAEVGADVIFYPDVGMASDTYVLAHARLAPVQAVAAGHPDTTGLASLDYFISADALEPAGAEAHYVERLVRLDRLPVFLERAPLLAERPPRQALGLPASGRLYGCPHTLFKFHPQFDGVLAAIAEADPQGWIIAPEADRPSWTARLKARWRERHPILAERVVWLPRAPREAFLAQLSHYDVLLDPLHFGCGHTLYLAMGQGVPVLTHPGDFARGRVVAGAYRQIGAGGELIVDRASDYARAAVALAADEDRRHRLGAELREAAEAELFCDEGAVRGLEAFFRAAVAAAAVGERLPSGWRP